MAEFLLLVAAIAVGLWYRPANWWLHHAKRMVSSPSAWKYAVGLGVLLLVASIFSAMPLPIFIGLAIFVPFWLNEIRILFASGDDAFPGRNDKLIWAIYLLFCPPVGVVFFRNFRERHWAKARREATDWI